MAKKLIIKIDGDDSGFRKKLEDLDSVAEKSFKATKTAIIAVSGALATATGAAVAFGSEFEQSAAKASTLFGDVAVDTENLNKKMLELSSSTGIAATELNESLYSALSAGIPVTEDMAEATGFLESSAKLAKAGFTDMDTALSATAKTLNAYGLSTSEAERIQGILIQTQNLGITTVGELGASLAQVTPTAAAFGVSFENVGAALATMTAQGTPTAQATTQLNSLIAELGKSGTIAAKNLEKAAQGTEYAGKSFKEMMEAGASLGDIMKLMSSQAEKSGLSMVDMFSSIEAGKAALSIASKEGKKFNESLEGMSNTAGMVEDAYDKVTDTLQGQTAKMKESLKNIAIAVYGYLEEPLKEATKNGISSVNSLSASISSGPLKNSLTELGNSLKNFMQSIITLAEIIIPRLISVITFLGNHFTGILSILLSLAAGMKTYTVVTNIAKNAMSAYSAVKSVITSVTISYTTAEEAATAATLAMNAAMKANVIGLVIGLVAALVTGLGMLIATHKSEANEIDELTQKMKEQSEAYEQMKKSAEESAEAGIAQLDHITTLKNELLSLADANGRVEEKDRARAEFILGELNNALGTQYSMQGNIISQYGELCDSIDTLIQKQRAQILLDAYKEEYAEAIKQQAEAKKGLAENTDKLLKAEKELSELENSVTRSDKAVFDKKQEIQNLQELIKGYANTIETTSNDISTWEAAATASMSGHYEDAEKILTGSTDTLNKYKSDTKQTLEDVQQAYILSLSDLKTAMQNYQADPSADNLAILKKSLEAFQNAQGAFIAAGGQMIDGIMIGANGKEIDLNPIINQIAVSADLIKPEGLNFSKGFAQGIRDGKIYPINAAVEVVVAAIKAAKKAEDSHSPSKETAKQIGAPFSQGVALGIESENDTVSKAAETVVEEAIENSSNLISRISTNAGKTLVDGIAVGIIDHKYQLKDSVKNMFSDLDLKHELEVITEEEYYSEMEKLRDKYIKKGTKEWWDYTKKIISYEKNLIKESIDNFKDTVETTEDLDEREYKHKKDLGILSNNDEIYILKQKISRYKGYLSEVEKLEGISDEERADLTEKYIEEMEDTYMDMYDLLTDEAKNAFDEIFKNLDDDLEDLEDRIKEIEDKRDNFEKKLNEYNPIYKKVTFENAPKGFEEGIQLTDWEEANQKLEGYTKLLNDLSNKVNNKAFSDMIIDMGIDEGSELATYLLGMSDADLQKYIEGWQRNQELTKSLATEQFQDDFDKLDNEYQELKKTQDDTLSEMKSKLEEWYGEVPEGFFDCGTLSFEEFKKGFTQNMQQLVDDVVAEISNMWSGNSQNMTNNTTNNFTYTFNGSGETVSQMLQSARNDAKLKELRGW